MCGYQNTIIVSTAKRLIPTARSPTITASSISMCKKNTQFVRLRVVNLESVLWRGLAPRKARRARPGILPLEGSRRLGVLQQGVGVSADAFAQAPELPSDTGRPMPESQASPIHQFAKPESHPATLGIDSCSTIGLFVGEAQVRVRRASKVLTVTFVGGLLVACVSSLGLATAGDIVTLWWTLPFVVALASLAILAGSLVFGGVFVRRVPAKLLSTLYLLCCPSLAAFSLPASLSPAMAPPVWAGLAASAMLLTSAWAYYRSLKYSDEGEEEPPLTNCAFETQA